MIDHDKEARLCLSAMKRCTPLELIIFVLITASSYWWTMLHPLLIVLIVFTLLFQGLYFQKRWEQEKEGNRKLPSDI